MLWLLANVGNALLFCLTAAPPSSALVSTRRLPRPGRLTWKVGVVASSLLSRLALIRASSDCSFSVPSALDELAEGVRSGAFAALFDVFAVAGADVPFGVVAPSPPAPPGPGSSVWMQQQRLPYGHEPETQKVLQISVLYCR